MVGRSSRNRSWRSIVDVVCRVEEEGRGPSNVTCLVAFFLCFTRSDVNDDDDHKARELVVLLTELSRPRRSRGMSLMRKKKSQA